jgi:hypothetical protein
MKFYVFCVLFTCGAAVGVWQLVGLRRDADRVVNAVDSLRFYMMRASAAAEYREALGRGKLDPAWLNSYSNAVMRIPVPADGGMKAGLDEGELLPEPVWDDAAGRYRMPGGELSAGADARRPEGF